MKRRAWGLAVVCLSGCGLVLDLEPGQDGGVPRPGDAGLRPDADVADAAAGEDAGPVDAERCEPDCGPCERCQAGVCVPAVGEPCGDGYGACAADGQCCFGCLRRGFCGEERRDDACGEGGDRCQRCGEGEACRAGRCVGTWVGPGGQHSCVVRDGDLACWGLNDQGQVTVPADGDVPPTRVTVPSPSDWRTVDGGSQHTCAITDSAELYCWGTGRLVPREAGQTRVAPQRIPSDIGSVRAGDWTDVSAGDRHTCAIREAQLFCWGDNRQGQLGTTDTSALLHGFATSRRWIQVSAGDDSSCAISEDRQLHCWGLDDEGQLGLGPGTGDVAAPAQVVVPGRPEVRFAQVGVNAHHACALSTRGELFCWGEHRYQHVRRGCDPGDEASCGTGLTLDRPEFQGDGFVELAVGKELTCALDASGGLSCWGGNRAGELGAPAVPGTNVVQVLGPASVLWETAGAGLRHACAAAQSGEVYCWGVNQDGQVLLDEPDPQTLPYPIPWP